MTPEAVRAWAAHERWAHGRVWSSLAALDESTRDDARFGRAVDKIAHIAAARSVWLWRMGGAPTPPEAVFPVGVAIDEARRADDASLDAWAGFLERADTAELAREVGYTSTEGSAFSNAVGEIVAHVWSHGFYHRGQVSTLIAQLGGEPLDADFIFRAREARR